MLILMKVIIIIFNLFDVTNNIGLHLLNNLKNQS